ncbi:MAG: L,D-transpeptidase family protein [Planctomycetes bacterium]|nr:L,D-transpeptidase family protein [Planctomycetota bacterium]
MSAHLPHAYRRRSTASMVIWMAALAAVTGLAAWQFQWLPGTAVAPTDVDLLDEPDWAADSPPGGGRRLEPLRAPLRDADGGFFEQVEPPPAENPFNESTQRAELSRHDAEVAPAGFDGFNPERAEAAASRPAETWTNQRPLPNDHSPARGATPNEFGPAAHPLAERPQGTPPLGAAPRREFPDDSWQSLPEGSVAPREAPDPAAALPQHPLRTADARQFELGASSLPVVIPAGGETAPRAIASGGMPEAAESAVPQNHPAAAAIAAIDRLLADGKVKDAHRELSTLYWKHPEWRPLLQKRIDRTAETIYFSHLTHFMEPCVVEPGENLGRIAARYKISWRYLERLNNIKAERLRAGQRLKVIKGPFSARIDLSDYELTVHAHGWYVRRYRIGIGQDGSTPVGTFAVGDKLINPTYYRPPSLGGGIVKADDPANPLGEYWISIGDGYGLHGTIEPDSIGQARSQGCIRMMNEDVAEVFDFLTEDSEVVIEP